MHNPDDSNTRIAHLIAQKENLELVDGRWEVVTMVREYFEEYHIVPEARTVLIMLRERMVKDKATGKCLYQLFP